ncbi:MAG: restriction endonuclease subunit S [Clostridiales bacterium]|nr:restriction endonuclease subunit S [Clostridiales bacterium]
MKYKLSQLMDILGGGTPRTDRPDYWNGNIPWLSVKDFKNTCRYVYQAEKNITQLGLENSSTQILSRNDLIISARGTVGEIAMISRPMAFNQSCYGLHAKESIITSEYLYYLLKNNIQMLKRNTHGTVFDTITRATFENLEVDIPTILVQQKIASVLSCFDSKIETNNRINKNLAA